MTAESLRAAAALPRALQRLRTALPPQAELLVVVLVLLLLELLGRHSPSDWIDAVGAIALADGCFLFATRRQKSARLAALLRARLARLGRALRTPHGLDLRKEPALPFGVPLAPCLALGAILIGLGSLLLGHGFFPGSAREVLRGLSGLASLLFVGLLWGTLAALSVGLWTSLFDGLRRRIASGSVAHGFGMGLLFAVSACAWRAPAALGLGLVVVAWSLPTAVLLGFAANVRLAWRPGSARTGTILRSGHLGLWEAAALTGVTALALVPVVLAVGDQLGGSGLESTSGTGLIGRFVLWSLGLGLTAFGATMVAPLVPARLSDPARARRPLVVLSGSGPIRAAKRILERAGYRCLGRAPRLAVSVGLQLLPAGSVPASESWTGATTLEELQRPDFLVRLARRHEVQSRRALTKGLARALTRLRTRRYPRGSGFWIAPHLWIATHPTRDIEAPGPRPAPWRRLLPLAARRSLAEAMTALDLDLLFVEDGVRPRAFRRVLELVFEHQDLFGTRRCEDVRHFSGLPGVRVVLHEAGLDLPPRTDAGNYPEPDYEEIGRARILHVFRDRGGELEALRIPGDRNRRPVAPRLSPLSYS